MKKNLIRSAGRMISFCVCLVALFILPSDKVSAAQAVISDQSGKVQSQIETTIVTTGTQANLADSFTRYTLTIPADEKTVVFPMKVTGQGIVQYTLYSNNAYNGIIGKAEFEMFADPECEEVVKNSDITLKFGTAGVTMSSTQQMYFEEDGMYYLKVKVADSAVPISQEYGFHFTIALQHYNCADRTLMNNVYTTSCGDSKHQNIYYKVKVDRSGYLMLQTQFIDGESLEETETGSLKMTLCNNKKKAISAVNTVSYSDAKSDGKSVYAVKKGTYYIKVTSGDGIYRLKSRFKAVTDKSGKNKKKARKMTVGKTYKGLVLQSDKASKTDWFKFVLKKDTEIELYFNGNTAPTSVSGLKLVIVPPKGTTLGGDTATAYGTDFKGKISFKNKLKKGTWYLKVQKTSDTGSGAYTLKIK